MKLPSLREELVVTEGPRGHDGQPGWILHDPVRNRFFRLDWPTFEILSRWSLGEPALIAAQVNAQTPLETSAADVLELLKFANSNQLLHLAGADNSAALAGLHARLRPDWWLWLVHNYLFFRIPLLQPERLLRWLYERLGFLFRPGFWWLSASALFAGLVILLRQWASFRATWVDFSNFNGFLGYVVVLVLIKVVHEFGHGLAAVHFGCRVPSMGIAFLVMTPVAYTDTNEAWKLRERRPRLLIGAAGMLAEFVLAAWATLAWGLLPDGALRAACFLVATTTWIKSLLINVSPIMRFDGYYLLSDALDIPNLHTRCFALARWRLRRLLFGLEEAPPEHFPRPLRRALVSLAMFIWLYRLVVFVGIAVFVYYFFFKVLGIVLFAIEIAWFVVLPIVGEVKEWWRRRGEILRSRSLFLLLGAVLLPLALVFTPLPRRLSLCGELYPVNEYRIVVPETARLVRLDHPDGSRVNAGDTLLSLESDVLRQRNALAQAREASLAEAVTAAGSDPLQRSRLPMLQGELGIARAATRESLVALSKLAPVAPFPGTLRLVDCDLRSSEVLGRHEHLATLVGDGPWQVTAYVEEQSRHLVSSGMRASFQPDGRPGETVRLRVRSVELDATRSLSRPMLATPFGGTIRVRADNDEWVPENAVYRVLFDVEEMPPELTVRISRGTLVVHADSEALASRWSRNALSLLWREFGF